MQSIRRDTEGPRLRGENRRGTRGCIHQPEKAAVAPGFSFFVVGEAATFFCSEVVGGVAEEPVVEVGDGAEQDGSLVGG